MPTTNPNDSNENSSNSFRLATKYEKEGDYIKALETFQMIIELGKKENNIRSIKMHLLESRVVMRNKVNTIKL